MGMYTELMLRCTLEKVPEEVSNMLRHMSDTYGEGQKPEITPNHKFFSCSRWRSIGWSNSYYFTPLACIEFSQSTIDADSWFLIVACDLKNYDNEIDLFLDWLKPYYGTKDYKTPIGWKRYEEDDEPTIIYTE